jgi:hypothetical protein
MPEPIVPAPMTATLAAASAGGATSRSVTRASVQEKIGKPVRLPDHLWGANRRDQLAAATAEEPGMGPRSAATW